MSNKSTLFQIFVLIFAAAIFSNCDAQTAPKENLPKNEVSYQESNTAAIEGKVESIIPEYEVKEKSVESLQALRMPEIWIVFESRDNLRVDLPAETLAFLNSYWKETIKLRHQLYIEKPNKGQEGQKISAAILNLAFKTENLLQESKINAPNEKRIISAKEAGEIMRTINHTADDLVDKAKNL